MTVDPATVLRLDGRRALVTGGTRGIGRAIAAAFVTAGADVTVLARKPDELDETRGALASIGGGAVAVVAGSAGDPAAVERAVGTCVDEFGGIDVLVNNAATNPHFGLLVDAEPAVVRKILEVNLEGPLQLTQAAWRAHMREHGGSIINVVSVGGIKAAPLIGAYNTSKAALIHLTKQLAMELAPGVRVNALAPGLVKTDFARALWEPDEAAAGARHPLGRIGAPDDIASAALFLASDAASWMTGQTVVVDGGELVAF